ncbi:hypothetical protein ACWG0P_07310 [Amedibacillus sp. YH-ame6]
MTKPNNYPCIERERIISKLYLTRTDVQKLLRRSWSVSDAIYEKARQMAVDKGKNNLEKRAYYEYVLECAGIKESDIHKMANLERKRIKSYPTDLTVFG